MYSSIKLTTKEGENIENFFDVSAEQTFSHEDTRRGFAE